MRRVLHPGGKALMFVPAFMFLWGVQDDISHHRRRYTLRGIQEVVKQAGFEFERHYLREHHFLFTDPARPIVDAGHGFSSGFGKQSDDGLHEWRFGKACLAAESTLLSVTSIFLLESPIICVAHGDSID